MQLADAARKWRTGWAIAIGALVVVINNPVGVSAHSVADIFASSAFAPAAASAPSLGQASSFGLLGGSTVTNTGSTTVHGDIGVSPGSAVTGFPPGAVTNGAFHLNDAVAGGAQGANTAAYNSLANQTCTLDLTGQDLGGKTLTEGVYCFTSAAQLTGALTLNTAGNGVFVFKIGSTLTTASNASVQINGGSGCNVFWQVGSSATLGSGTSFGGNILALQSITLVTRASVSGRALAQNGAVTLDTNNVDSAGCAVGVPTATPTGTSTATATATATPTPVPTVATATVVASTATATSAPAASSGGGGGHAPAATSVPQAAAPAPSGGAGVSGTSSATGGSVPAGAAPAPGPSSGPPPAPATAEVQAAPAGPAAAPAAPTAPEAPAAPVVPAAPEASTAPAREAAPAPAAEAPPSAAPEGAAAPGMPDASSAPAAPEASGLDSIQRLIQPTPVSDTGEDLIAPPAFPSSLPNTGDPFGPTIAWLTWAGAAGVLIGFSLLLGASLKRRR